MALDPAVAACNITEAKRFEKVGRSALYVILGSGDPDPVAVHAAVHDALSPAIQLFHIGGMDSEAERLLLVATDLATRAGATAEDLAELAAGLGRARSCVIGAEPPAPPPPTRAEVIADLEAQILAVKAGA